MVQIWARPWEWLTGLKLSRLRSRWGAASAPHAVTAEGMASNLKPWCMGRPVPPAETSARDDSNLNHLLNMVWIRLEPSSCWVELPEKFPATTWEELNGRSTNHSEIPSF